MGGVKVSGGSGLNFTAKLDISEIRKNAAEAKKLISDLTVTTNGISKGLDTEKTATQGVTDAIKQQRLSILEANKAKADANALAAKEKAAQAEINTQIKQNTLARQEELAATRAQAALDKERAAQHTIPSSTGFPEGNGQQEFVNATPLPRDTETPTAIKLLNDQLDAGIITAEEFRKEIEGMAEQQAFFAQKTAAAIVPIEEELGAIESLKLALKDLNAQKIGAAESDLPVLNREIQATELAITQLNNVGKEGFDEFGNKIKAVAVEMEKPIGQYNRLAYAAKLYEQQSKTSTNPDIITKYNAKLQDAQVQLKQLANVGKDGFDELGNKIKTSTGYLSSAWSGLRKIAQILPGIGIAGLIAFTTGPLIEWVTALIKGKDALDLALQSMIAFNAVQDDAAKAAAPQIATLQILAAAATDVTKSMESRLLAADKLKNTFPDELKNTTALAIANGALKDSYNDVAAAILKQAIVEASLSKIKELEAQKLEIKAKQIEIQAKADTDKSQATGYAASTVSQPGGGGQYIPAISVAQNQAGIQQLADYQKTKLQPSIDAIDSTIKSVIKAAGGASVLADSITGANKLINATVAQFDILIKKASSKEDLDTLKASLQAKLDALAPGDSQIAAIRARLQKIDDLEKQYQVKPTPTTDPAVQLLASQKSVLAQLDALKDKYASKDKTRNDQEQDDIIADFKKRGDLIDAQNTKYNQYLKTHTVAQAKAAGLSLIDKSQLAPEQTNALAGLAGRQAVVALQQQVDQQKSIYKEYEDFKLKAGTEAADELYGTQIGDFTSYVDYLKSLQPTIDQLNSPDAKIKAKASATQDFLNKEQAKADTDALVQNKKYLEQYLTETQSFADSQSTIINKTNDEVSILTKASSDRQVELREQGFTAEADAVQADYDRRIKIAQDQGDALLQQQVLQQKQQVESYKGLSDTIANMAPVQAKLSLDQAANNLQLNKGKMSAADYAVALKYLNQAYGELKIDIVINGLKSLESVFGDLATATDIIDKKLSSTFKSISEFFGNTISLVSGIKKLSDAIDDFKEKQKLAADASKSSFLGTVSTIASMIPIAGAVISAGIKIVTGVVNFFKAAKATAIASAAELVAYQQRIIDGQITYNEYLREQARSQQDINDLTGTELQTRLQLLNVQKQQAQADFNTLLAQGAATGQYVTGEHTEKYGGVLGIGKKTKVVQDTASIAGMTYDQINELDIEGKLTGPTKDWFDQLKASNTEISDINDALAEAQAQTDQIFTGTTASSIADSILEGFKAGKRTMEDFAGDFQTLMQNAMLSTFESDYLDVQLKKFYADFAARSEKAGGLTDADEAALKQEYADIITGAAADLDNIQKLTGPLGGSSDDSATTAKGQIEASITEDTASRLYGVFAGTQTATLQVRDLLTVSGKTIGDLYQSAQGSFAQLVIIAENTKRGADNTDGIATTLKNIESNTKGTSMRGAGLG
jgi:hypothetical protein